MTDTHQPERRTTVREPGEQRSIDPQAVIDGAQVFGAATGGTGALLVGVAKIKETFGGGQEPAAPAGSESPAPRQD